MSKKRSRRHHAYEHKVEILRRHADRRGETGDRKLDAAPKARAARRAAARHQAV